MKAKHIVFAVIIFLVVVLQNTLFEHIEIFNTRPNLMLVVIISCALLYGNVQGAIVGFILGLCYDITSGRMLGLHALLGLYLGLGVGIVNKRLYRENFIVIIFFTFISTIAYGLAEYILSIWCERIFAAREIRMDLLFAAKNKILPLAIYNSIISIPVYAVTMLLKDKFESNKGIRKY